MNKTDNLMITAGGGLGPGRQRIFYTDRRSMGAASALSHMW